MKLKYEHREVQGPHAISVQKVRFRYGLHMSSGFFSCVGETRSEKKAPIYIAEPSHLDEFLKHVGMFSFLLGY